MFKKLLTVFLTITLVFAMILMIRDSRTNVTNCNRVVKCEAYSSLNGGTEAAIAKTNSNSIMTIHFIDVGQGDSIFVDFNEYEILLDAGGLTSGIEVANYIEPYVDGNLEIMIGTHVHEDHIGGLSTILSLFQVDQIIDSGDTVLTKAYKEFSTAALKEVNCNYHSDEDLMIQLGNGAIFKVIETGDGRSNVNNNSVVTLIDYNYVEVLLTGDMEASAEKSNLHKLIDVDVLKAGHHGSNTASSQDFLHVVKPETVIISCGIGNIYGHPHKEAMERFLNMGASVYGTFQSGNIVMTTDGNSYSFNTSRKLTIKDANPEK